MSRSGASQGLQGSIRGCVDALDVPALGPVLGAGRGGGCPRPLSLLGLSPPLSSAFLCRPGVSCSWKNRTCSPFFSQGMSSDSEACTLPAWI